MTSSLKCCVRGCPSMRGEDCSPILHSFPNPDKDGERFRTWIYSIGGDVLVLDENYVYMNRKVCHKHFETKYHTRSSRLSANAVPTLNLKGTSRKRPFEDITNTLNEPSTSSGPSQATNQPSCVTTTPSTKSSDLPTLAEKDSLLPEKSLEKKCISLKQRTPVAKKDSNLVNLQSIIGKLQKTKTSYKARLKKALKLTDNTTFQKCLKRFTTLAAIFTVMQFREITKRKMGRRFTKDEKIMALSLYKQGPKAYRWLSKIFILPSPITLSRLISRAGLVPGLNEKIFKYLTKRVKNMTEDEKLCILLFDEIAITPHFDYNKKRDLINGFVTNGQETKQNIADHALVFMLRGVLKNYKQPLAYTFCKGTTPKEELTMLIRKIITELQKCGLKVLATVCDQGTTNVSCINSLIEETRVNYIKKNENFKHQIFEVNGENIIPLFDPPHLIKGIRNNLITKNLKYVIDGKEKIAKWDHIMKLHEENPSYKGIRLVKKLTEAHVDPKKMSKMKIKLATQVFSKTVASNMGYLADKGIIPKECKDTADVLLFFDDLFDSVNGSYDNSRKRGGKALLKAVTPKSEHNQVWARAKKTLKSMTFVTKDGKAGSVPSVRNWLRTIENCELLISILNKKYDVRSVWMRHINQDPLENFFGCIRSHGYRNNSPTPQGFESAFASLLINNMSSNHSVGSNCEQDKCKVFKSVNYLLKRDKPEIINIENIDFEDINCEIVDFSKKQNNEMIMSQLSYVAGYLLKQANRKVYKNCEKCKDILFDKQSLNEYIKIREFSERRSLVYPSENVIKMFSAIQDVATYILETKSDMPQIKNYIKTLLYVTIDFNFLKSCPDHGSQLVDFLFELGCRFFICNWCREINNLLIGTRTDNLHGNDMIKKLACEYFIKRNKLRKPS